MKYGILFFLMGSALYAQQNELARDAFTLRVKRNASQEFIQSIPSGSYVVQGTALQLYPHERVLLELDIRADTIFAMKAVKNNVFPERTLDVEFCQEEKENKSAPSTLYLKNPLQQQLKFQLMGFYVEESQWMGVDKQTPAGKTTAAPFKKVMSSLVLKDLKLEAVQKD